MAWYDYVNSAINPVKQFKYLGGKFGGYASSATGHGDATSAPGAAFAYNPNSKITAVAQGARADGAPNAAGASGVQMPPSLRDQTGHADPWNVSDKTRQNLLAQQGGLAGQFADQNQQSYAQYGAQGQSALNGLQATANGQNSISAMQLQQSNQQSLGQQQAIAAGAAPQNQAAAARTAAIQSGRISSGLAGQQALAGLQERNQAQGQYGALLQGLRGQDLNAALQSRQNASSGYGAGNTGAPQKTWTETYGPAIQAGAALVASDRRLKTDVKDGTGAADSALKGLSAHSYKYRDESKHGKGERVGIMAQDLESAGLGHAVIDTKGGKMVHGGHLATALAAMMPGLDKRIGKLEGKR